MVKHTAKAIIILGFLLALFAPDARGESPNPQTTHPLGYIAGLGRIAFNSQGGGFLPLSVLRALAGGQVSATLQMILGQMFLNQCTQRVLRYRPDVRDSYLTASFLFQTALCELTSCVKQMMAIQLLPQQSTNPNTGGSADASQRDAAKQQLGLLLAVLQKDKGCGRNGGGSGFDPALLQFALGAGSNP